MPASNGQGGEGLNGPDYSGRRSPNIDRKIYRQKNDSDIKMRGENRHKATQTRQALHGAGGGGGGGSQETGCPLLVIQILVILTGIGSVGYGAIDLFVRWVA